MAKLPRPSWLTLPETLDWLEESGISKSDAKLHLPRAFRDSDIKTRGRSDSYNGHDTKTGLHEVIWDQAEVDWEENSFTIPFPDFFVDHLITDVDVYLEDLFRWIGESETQHTNLNTTLDTAGQPRKRGPSFKYDWDSFNVEVVVMADLDSLPDTQSELEKVMAQWCEDNWGEQPSESTIRSKVAPIYNHPRKQQGR
jgi:hypothetical protein